MTKLVKFNDHFPRETLLYKRVAIKDSAQKWH